MGLIRLRPCRGRVVLLARGCGMLDFWASGLVYQGPLPVGPKQGEPLYDRGRIVEYGSPDTKPLRLTLQGFGAALDPGRAEKVFGRSDEIRLDLAWIGPLRLSGFRAGEVRLWAEPGGVFFVLRASAREAVRLRGEPGGLRQTSKPMGEKNEIHQ